MKYIIKENRINELVFNFLEDHFKDGTIISSHPEEYDSERGHYFADKTRVEFIYLNEPPYGDPVFRWTSCDYFIPNSYAQTICPTLVLENETKDLLLSWFGENIWEEPFRLWFEEKYKLPVKTIEYY